MITLPQLATGLKTGAHARTTSNTGADADVTDATNPAGGEALPAGFLTLLGNRLLTLAQQQEPAALAGKGVQKADIKAGDDKKLPAGELSALLSAFEQPGTLNALLQPEKAKGIGKNADDKDQQPLQALPDSDKQALQALFAMLPQPVAITPPAQTLTQNAAGESQLLSTPGKSNGNTLLNTLVSQTASAGKDDAADPALPGLNAAPGVVNQQTSTSSTAQPLDASFQQMLGGALKESVKDQGESSAAAQLTSAMSSASSVAMTPTASATTSTPMTPQLNAQLGSPEWQQALSQQVLLFSRNGQQTAQLQLHPEDLGSIQISLKIDNDQAQISMVSGHGHVRAALEAAMPQLRTAFAENGINLGQSDVSSDSSSQNQAFNGQQENRRDAQNGAFSLGQDHDSAITPLAVPAALQARATGSGAVDIFA